MNRPNVLYVMTDQQRWDTIAALGNPHIHTPNFDRLVRRGVSFTRAYSPCPVCVPARYVIRTGCLPPATGSFQNGSRSDGPWDLAPDQPEDMEQRCGPFLARRMSELGYRTFGIGKFHARHADLGYETYLLAGEGWGSPEHRMSDAYARWIAEEHPEFSYVEQLHGERTEMYYMPQTAPLPPELCHEYWATDRAIEQVNADDGRPYFGFVSFVGPHPPLAPPIPFNRLYNPDEMPSPVRGDPEADHMDEQIPWMNEVIWADGVDDLRARACKARYYGEITFIDHCIGRLLDAVEAREDADDTLICFFTDHGDHMGDHDAWQKESFYEGAAHIPFLLSWPGRVPADERRDELVSLVDLVGLATAAAGKSEPREGVDLLAMLDGRAEPREHLIGMYDAPGSRYFKIMVRAGDWKYIFMANGGREQLFNLVDDPDEIHQRANRRPDVVERLRRVAEAACRRPNADRALDESGRLRAFDFEARETWRIRQFDRSSGVTDFADDPAAVIRQWEQRSAGRK